MKWAECLHHDYNPDEWDSLMQTGDCPGYYSKYDARYDERIRFAEKG